MTRSSTTPEQHLRVADGLLGEAARDRLLEEYVSTLALPPDDMWFAFSGQADPIALLDGDDAIGFAAIDAEGELHQCYLRSGHEYAGSTMLQLIAQQRPVRTMIAATTDPVALTLLLPHAKSVTPVALLYHHEHDPDGRVLEGMRVATVSDRTAVTTFVAESVGEPPNQIEAYIRARIDNGELLMHHVDGNIAGIGEQRAAPMAVGHAHLGIVVGVRYRGNGLGGAIMNTLVNKCRREQLAPLCSTQPDNVAAQRLIHRAGFRSRHSTFRLVPVA